jgi:tyrosinase
MAMPRDVDLSICLRDPDFPADPVGGSHGFGGPETKFNHDERDGSRRAGDLELQPHNTIHGDVGGATGFMGAFNTAALDPLFWLHHANIDRLWEVWRHRDPAHKNPSGGVWSSLPFDLHDSDGKPIKFVASDVEDTTAPKLKYRYEDVSDPLPAMVRTAAPVRALMAQKPIPEMVGASEKPVSVAGAPATTSVLLSAPTGPARVALAASAPKKAYLNIENVTGTGATTYSVYLNLPAKSDHTKHEDLFAGLLPTFGVREATRRDERHSGSGLHFTLEVTDLIHRLSEQQNWDPKSLSVTFVPKSDEDEPVEIHVGRVSLYYA